MSVRCASALTALVLFVSAASFAGWLAWMHRPYKDPDWQSLFLAFKTAEYCEAARYIAYEAGDAGDLDGYKKILELIEEEHPCAKSTFLGDSASLRDWIAYSGSNKFDVNSYRDEISPYTSLPSFVAIIRDQWRDDDFPGARLRLTRQQAWAFLLCFNSDLSIYPRDYASIEHAIQSVQGKSEPYNPRRTRNRARCADLSYAIAEEMRLLVRTIDRSQPTKAKIDPVAYEKWLETAAMFGSSEAAFDDARLWTNTETQIIQLKKLAYEKKFIPAIILLAEWSYNGTNLRQSKEAAEEFALAAQDQGATLPDYLQDLVDEMTVEEKTIARGVFQSWGRDFIPSTGN